MKFSKLNLIRNLALSVSLLVCLASCATIEGAGTDIKSAGEAVQDAAN